MALDLTKNAPMSAIKELGDRIKDIEVTVDEGSEANKINSISVNGTVQTPDENKRVNITVPTTTSDLTNDSDFQTSDEVAAAINAKLGGVYTPKGSELFADLPDLSAENVGSVYNITDAFITTEDFLEGAGKSYAAGTNVAIVESESGVYKYDVLSGFVNMSNYYTKTEIDAKTATNEEVTELINSIFTTT